MHQEAVTPLESSRAFFLVGFLLACSSAVACPLCHTETGKQVRSGIFDADFGFNLLITVIPFAIFLGIVALIYFGPPTLSLPSKLAQQSSSVRARKP